MSTKENVQKLVNSINGNLFNFEVNSINYIATSAEIFEGICGDCDQPFEPFIFIKVQLNADFGYNSTECSLLFEPEQVQTIINNQSHQHWHTYFTFENDGSYGEK